MKRKLLLSFFIATITCTLSQAQIKKGSIFLGGNVSFSTTKEKREAPLNDGKYTDVTIYPAWGKALKDNLIVGVDILYSFHESNPYDPTGQSSNYIAIGAGLFIRKYAPLGKGFYLFGQGRLGAAGSSQKYDSQYTPGAFKVKGYSVTAGFYPGISYAISNKLHVETGFANLVNIYFTHSKTTPKYPTIGNAEWKQNTIGLGTSVENPGGLTIGLRLILSKA